MDIIVGNEHGQSISNTWTRPFAFHLATAPWERDGSNYSPFSYRWIIEQIGLTLVWQPIEEKENYEFKSVKLRFRIELV